MVTTRTRLSSLQSANDTSRARAGSTRIALQGHGMRRLQGSTRLVGLRGITGEHEPHALAIIKAPTINELVLEGT
jgi:hypothetical protein